MQCCTQTKKKKFNLSSTATSRWDTLPPFHPQQGTIFSPDTQCSTFVICAGLEVLPLVCQSKYAIAQDFANRDAGVVAVAAISTCVDNSAVQTATLAPLAVKQHTQRNCITKSNAGRFG